jgi:hypothetical protein
MDIEYQKKEVTWCLDRDGPRICLRAVAINDELQYLQISSESFNLDLKTTEAQEFLAILRKLNLSKEPAISLGEKLSADIVKEISTEIFDEVPIEFPTISSLQTNEVIKTSPSMDASEILEVLEQSELNIDNEVDVLPIISSPSPQPTKSLELSPVTDTSEILEIQEHSEFSIENGVDESSVVSSSSPQPTESSKSPLRLDTSEILNVLKQSESEEEEKPVKIRRLGSLFGMEEQVTLTPSKDTSRKSDVYKRSSGELEDDLTQLTDIIIGREEPKVDSNSVQIQEIVKGISTEENVKPSVILGGRVDTASFFHKAEEKSPLEQLLDDDEEEEILISSERPLVSSDEHSKLKVESIENKRMIGSKEITPYTPDDLQSSSFISDFNSKKMESNLDTGIVESHESDLQPSSNASQKLEPISEGSYITESERKKQIEKEREARKKRLWELTRGF